VATSGSFDWLNAEEEDIYSLEDGEAVQMAPVRSQTRSVVLIRYPFTDLSGAKVRPALVLTPTIFYPVWKTYSAVHLLCHAGGASPHGFHSGTWQASFLKTGLKRRSVLRMHKLPYFTKTSCCGY